MRHSAVFIVACLLSVISATYAATVVRSGLISFNGLILTSNGDGNQVTLVDQGVCLKTQRWVQDSDGYIYQEGNQTLVLDVKDSNKLNGAQVIMWIKKSGPNVDPTNQLWNVNGTQISSRLTGSTFAIRRSSSSNGVVNSNNTPLQVFQFIQTQYTCPSTCQSHGDPHFVAWNGRKFDFQSANTVLLANFTGAKVYAVQFPCNTGVTCNEGFIVYPSGTNTTFQLTYSQAWVNATMTTISGTVSYGSSLNVTKISNTQYVINVPGGVITYGIYSWYRGLYANIDVTITSGYPGPSICMGPAAGQNAHAFGSQYLIMAANQTAYQYTQTNFSYNPNYVPNYGPYTTDDQALIANATRICNQLNQTNGPFAQCNLLVDPTYYIGTCYNDSIAMGTVEFARSSIDAYARMCQEAATRNGTTVTLPTSSISSLVVVVNFTVPQNSQASFIIISKDAAGRSRTTGGDMYFINSTGPSMLNFTVIDNGDGTYTVWYTPTAEGTYWFWVKLNGVDDVTGSPFSVNVTAVTNAVTTSFVFGPVPVNSTQMFTIQARTSTGTSRTQGGDTFVVTSTGADIVGVTDNGNGTYVVTYIPRATGSQQINVSYNGTPIGCSPYTVIVM